MKGKKADFVIRDVFLITGRGLILAGSIEQGDFATGDTIEFTLSGALCSYRIKGIEMIRLDPDAHWQKRKGGLLIDCNNEQHIQELRVACKDGIAAVIYTSA